MFGFRADGKKLKGLDPIQKIMPHIMSARHDSQNLCRYDTRCEAFDKFIKEQRELGHHFNYMHLVIAGAVRTIALYPRLNRFVMNGRIYHRKGGIYVSFVVKKSLSANAADSQVKLCFTGKETIYEIKDMIDEAIKANSKVSANNGTDKLARFLTFIPNCIIKFAVGTLKFLDKHGMLPNAILKLSPFHTTLFITNLKSIKGESIYHHLYDFGTTGLFISMGKEKMVPVVDDGQIVPGKVMTLDVVTDERFCDGFYFVTALKSLKKFYGNPEILCEGLEELPEDTEVIDIHSRRYKRKMKKAAKKAAKEQAKLEKVKKAKGE